jgi:hypothetical protein
MQQPGSSEVSSDILQAWCDSKAHFIAPPKRKDDRAGAVPPVGPDGASAHASMARRVCCSGRVCVACRAAPAAATAVASSTASSCAP